VRSPPGCVVAELEIARQNCKNLVERSYFLDDRNQRKYYSIPLNTKNITSTTTHETGQRVDKEDVVCVFRLLTLGTHGI
jgi:hypothetical protein